MVAKKDRWHHDWRAAISKLRLASELAESAEPKEVKEEILPILKKALADIERLSLLQDRNS